MHYFISFFLALFLVMASAMPLRAAEVVDRIVAIANGKMITLSDVNKSLKLFLQDSDRSALLSGNPKVIQEMQKKVLSRMIDDLLLADKAAAYKLTVTDTEMKSYIRDFKKENKLTDDTLRLRLQQDNMTMKEYEDKVKQNILRNRMLSVMVQRKVVVTEEEIQAYYNQHKGSLGSTGKSRVSLIVLPPKQDPLELKKKIESGEMSFEAAAKKISVGPNAAAGGSLGEVEIKDLNDDLRGAVENLKQGEVSKPFQLAGKSALARLDSAAQTAGDVKPLEEVKAQIKRAIEEPKLEAMFEEYMKKLRSEAVIDIRM